MTIIPANKVATGDKDLFSKVEPYTNNGMKYYKVLNDGNWEGKGGQIIYAADVARANLDKTALNEANRGRTNLKPTLGNPKPASNKMVTMVLPNGVTGQIPEDKVAEFLKDNPKAKRQ